MKTIPRSFLYILLPVALLGSITVAKAFSIIANPDFKTGAFSGWTQSGNTSHTSVSEGGYAHSGAFGAYLGGPVGPKGKKGRIWQPDPFVVRSVPETGTNALLLSLGLVGLCLAQRALCGRKGCAAHETV